MSRRPHKKSRNGCLECKKRHIRCDGNQPICFNCRAAENRCSFLGSNSPSAMPAFSQSYSQATTPGTVSTATSTPAPSLWPEHTMSSREPSDPSSINMTHLELFNNLYSKEFLSIEDSSQPDIIPASIYIKYALTTPYLMYQTLAASALHLSTQSSKSRNFYRDHATVLQNRALSLFNESNPAMEVTPTNCVQMFLFSSAVGVHLLCDALHYPRDSLEDFINKFTDCLSVYRGVLAITDPCWHLLYETELGPRLESSHFLMQQTNRTGSECEALQELINVVDVSPSLRKAYRESVLHLQRGFDAQRDAPGNEIRVPVILGWPILVSSEYADSLRERHAEALIILAHYAVLLHRGQHLWLIGEGGRFLIESICESLGFKWQEWLKFPRAALQENMTA